MHYTVLDFGFITDRFWVEPLLTCFHLDAFEFNMIVSDHYENLGSSGFKYSPEMSHSKTFTYEIVLLFS